MILGAIEGGGTKMVCAITDEKGNIIEKMSVPTLSPEETIPPMLEFFKGKNIECLGIACFGPIDLNEESKTYGYITTTPKTRWMNFDFVGAFRELNVPIGFDTDVNGSVIGEATFGRYKGFKDGIYITIGTGIGIGVISGGNLVHGMLHPEGGHMLLVTHQEDPMPKGICPFHPNCFEGYASGPSIKARWGKNGAEIEDDAFAWELESYYVAQAIVNMLMILSPEIVILGGGVSHKKDVLLPLIHKNFKKLLNGYIKTEKTENPEKFIVAQSMDDNQGILGAAIIGLNAYNQKQQK